VSFFISDMTDHILDEIANILIHIEKVNPQCIAQLSLNTDVMCCLNLSSMQFMIFKNQLKKTFNLPFDHVDTNLEKLLMKEIVSYVLIHSKSELLFKWGSQLKTA